MDNHDASYSPDSHDSVSKQSEAKTSERRRQASRENGKKSRGPKTERGKHRSRHNAVKHGLLARYAVVSHPAFGESEEQFQQLVKELYLDRKPEGALEEMLVQMIAACFIKEARAARYESGHLLNSVIETERFIPVVPSVGMQEVSQAYNEAKDQGCITAATLDLLKSLGTVSKQIFKLNQQVAELKTSDSTPDPELRKQLIELLAAEYRQREQYHQQLTQDSQRRRNATIARLALPDSLVSDTISRYLRDNDRRLYQLFAMLERLQSTRKSERRRQTEDQPTVIDVED